MLRSECKQEKNEANVGRKEVQQILKNFFTASQYWRQFVRQEKNEAKLVEICP